eukprot:scaffold11408_cov146-Isochrysis_galbana.AAC.1
MPGPMPPPPARCGSNGALSTGASPRLSPAMRAALAPGIAPFALDATDGLGISSAAGALGCFPAGASAALSAEWERP